MGSTCRDHPDETPSADAAVVEYEPGAIPGYELTGVRGRGGFADVLAGRRLADGRAVAVKLLRKSGDPRAEREAEVLRRLGPPIGPELVDAGTRDDGRPWIAMDDLGSDSLAARLAERDYADRGTVLDELEAIAGAIDAMHAAGVVHRDIKPENLFFRSGGEVSLIDFGLARGDASERDDLPDPSLTRTGERMGTLLYMAPEQWEDARAAGRPADIYAFGVVAFEMLTGRPPFVGDPATLHHRHATERCPPASALAAVGRKVDAVFEIALAKLPDERYRTATAVVEALRAALAAAPGRADTPEIEVVGEVLRTAIVALESDAPAHHIAELAERSGAVVAAIEGGRYLLVVPASSVAAGLRDADRLARRALRDQLAHRAVVHAAVLSLRTGRGGRVTASGRALREADAWAGDDDGELTHTPEAAAYLSTAAGSSARPLSAIDPRALPLVGRDRELRAAADALTGATGPILATVIGEPGSGKSRFLAALADALDADVDRVVRLAPVQGDPDALARSILRLTGDPIAAPPTIAAGHAARLVLGLADDRDPGVAALLEAPGALRQATARAIATALVSAAAETIAIVIDDAEHADHAVLDGIELATMNERDEPLAIVVAADPQLERTRPRWGGRAATTYRAELGTLDVDAAHAILSHLLHPVEYVPAPVLERLIELSEGRAGNLVELAQSIRASGAIRGTDSASAFVVASDELLDIASRDLAERIGRHAADHVARSLAPLASACAVLGDPISGERVRALQHELSPAHPLQQLDAPAGLARLARRGLLRETDAGFQLRSPLLAQGLERATDRRDRRALHRAALAVVDRDPDATLEQRARHAAGCGEAVIAADCFATLGEKAMARHRFVDAERCFGIAIDHADTDSRARETALAGRGRARYRLQRFGDAIADLSAARELARARGDDHAVARLLLDEATALDIYCEHGKSRERFEQAKQLAATVNRPALDVSSRLAEGRSLHRAGRYAEAADILHRVARDADRLGLYEDHVIALLMLMGALYECNRWSECEAVHERLVELCERAGDEFHLAAAFNNLQILRVRQHRMDLALDALRTSLDLGRALGNASLEWTGGQNLCECYVWTGDLDAARALALRGLELASSLSPANTQASLVSLARVYAAQNDPEMGAWLERIDELRSSYALAPWEEALVAAVRLLTSSEATSTAWDHLLEGCRDRVPHDVIREIAMLAAMWACDSADAETRAARVERARVEVEGVAFWANRLRELEDLACSDD